MKLVMSLPQPINQFAYIFADKKTLFKMAYEIVVKKILKKVPGIRSNT